jgi:hypothetical protein
MQHETRMNINVNLNINLTTIKYFKDKIFVSDIRRNRLLIRYCNKGPVVDNIFSDKGLSTHCQISDVADIFFNGTLQGMTNNFVQLSGAGLIHSGHYRAEYWVWAAAAFNSPHLSQARNSRGKTRTFGRRGNILGCRYVVYTQIVSPQAGHQKHFFHCKLLVFIKNACNTSLKFLGFNFLVQFLSRNMYIKPFWSFFFSHS